jgi:sporulation protein YlmC with PRC-barrel domain
MAARGYRAASGRDAALLGTTSFYGDSVYDVAGRFVGEIEELVVDIESGRIAYALMAIGGFLGMGRQLFAMPWAAVTVDRTYQRCVINVDLERLIGAPAPDGDLLPRMADPDWARALHAYFGCRPYWE